MNTISMSEAQTEATPAVAHRGLSRADFMALTKFRLSFLVIVTTFMGFWLRRPDHWSGWLLFHTLLGSALAAFGAAIFNQLMEIEPDSRMHRTADRPLPSRRVEPGFAFGMGWLLSAFAIMHLVKMVNLESAALAAMTLGVYLFVYTPMKQQSSWNTIVGAISGALPPLIGWTAAVGEPAAGASYFRYQLVLEPGAIFLFALLFLWQLPHFLAINWMYRDEYRRGGFVMWANEDESGKKTATLALIFTICAALLMIWPLATHCVTWMFAPVAAIIHVPFLWRAWTFFKQKDRGSARRLFLFTLLYLPLILVASAVFWRR